MARPFPLRPSKAQTPGETMKRITGDLSLMHLTELAQWADMNSKTGTLTISNGGVSKKFYLQEGKIIYVASGKSGERLGEILEDRNDVDAEAVRRALEVSRSLGVPFTGHLISEGIVDMAGLEAALVQCAEVAFTDALHWENGTFEFTDEVPAEVDDGPIKLNTSFVLFESVRRFDEARKRVSDEGREFMEQLRAGLDEGSIELPPVPDIMTKIHDIMRRDDAPVREIVKIIMADQILTSRLLRVVNSAFYGLSGEVTSLQQAVVYLGFKAVLGIVTVHTMSAATAANERKVKDVLRHSLLCAFIARRLAESLRLDPEEAFVCGLLHDIGKTLLFSLKGLDWIDDDDMDEIAALFHCEAGGLLAARWRFSDVVKEVIVHHHAPEKTPSESAMVETVFLADAMANGRDTSDTALRLRSIEVEEASLKSIGDEMASMREMVNAVI
ncbi:MAG TPA: HDOD domain-containing protein [Deltaproteobacteria bacterium]|nr:HDOD domain-containing protein [Deltaproteobacteria bacterium]